MRCARRPRCAGCGCPATPLRADARPALMAECDPPRDVAAMTAELIARKAATRELGEAPLPALSRGLWQRSSRRRGMRSKRRFAWLARRLESHSMRSCSSDRCQ